MQCRVHTPYNARVETKFVRAKTEIQGYDTTDIVKDILLRILSFGFQDHRAQRTDRCPKVSLKRSGQDSS
jgi:hypothetical protein